MEFTHASLFSGIGGFDLAADKIGWKNVFHCEINPFCRKILNYYWPNAISYEDITKTDFTIWNGKIDILTGGFPCQPYSLAGKRLGKADNRHLWPEMLRAIQEIQPTWIVGENVYGLVNWNDGLAFEEVQADLENEGYEVQPFILPACAVGAPHRRDRIWFVAYSNHKGRSAGYREISRKDEKVSERASETCGFNDERTASDTNCKRFEKCDYAGISKRKSKQFDKSILRTENWENFPTQSPVCGGNDGISSGLDGITFSKWRNESIKAYGNAVVPQIPYQIFKVIEEINKTWHS